MRQTILILLLFFSGVGSAATLTFDELASGTEVTTQYAAQGVVFSSSGWAGGSQVTNVLDLYGSPFLLPNGPAPDHGGTLIIDFLFDVRSVSSDLVEVYEPGGPMQINIYDLNSGLIGSTTGLTEWSFSSAALIGRVELIGKMIRQRPDGWGIDNLTYTDNVVPVPAAVWLFGSALLGLAVNRRIAKGKQR